MMKNLLICGLALGFSISAIAQNRVATQQGKQGLFLKDKAVVQNGETFNNRIVSPGNKGPVKMRTKSSTPTTQAVSVFDIGSSGNAFGTGFGAKTALFAHPVINTVSMIYRSAPAVTGDVNSGFLRYGLSTDGGTTWSTDQGPVYSPDAANIDNGAPARYPQSIIYNPVGNTTPNNASIAYFAPSLYGVGIGGSWGAHVHGATTFGTLAPTQVQDTSSSYLIPDGGALNPNDNSIWISNGTFDITTEDYNDNIMLAKGTWGTNDYSYAYSSVSAPLAADVDGDKNLVATNIAWGNNGVGYLAMIGHEDFVNLPDSNLYPVFYKTTDNGATWNRLAAIDLLNIDNILNIDEVDPIDSVQYTTGFEFDLTVDADNNVHMIVDVGALGASGFSIVSGPTFFAVVDIYTTDGGTSWFAQELGQPQTFRGEFVGGGSTIPEDNRPQVSRTLDGTKLFFCWFETDTLINPDNLNPDMWVMAYNTVTDLWAPAANVTTGTDADAAVKMGNVSPFVLENAGCYEIPMSYLEMQQTAGADDPSIQVTHKYAEGIEICDAAFTAQGSPVALNTVSVGIKELPSTVTNSFTLGQNFPNPFSGTTQFVLNLSKNSNVRVDIFSVVGNLVKSFNYDNMNSGVNLVTLDASDLASGMYTYTVNVGNEKATRTMIVK